MSNLFNRLTLTVYLFLVPIAYTGLLLADQDISPKAQQMSVETAVPPLALNDADVAGAKKSENSVADSGPVLLVPMVLAVLALVAVSRRKEG